jgi:hypothetical protein
MQESNGTALAAIFTDQRFAEIRRNCWFGVIDDVRVGVVVATRNPEYSNHALNKPELETLLAAKRDGKVDEAHVVAANVNGTKRTYCGSMSAEEVQQKIEAFWLQPRPGRYGEFYTLPLGFIPVEDSPF